VGRERHRNLQLICVWFPAAFRGWLMWFTDRPVN